MLGVFLLLAFTVLRHECQDLWSLCDGMYECTDKILIYTVTGKSFGRMESEAMLTPRVVVVGWLVAQRPSNM